MAAAIENRCRQGADARAANGAGHHQFAAAGEADKQHDGRQDHDQRQELAKGCRYVQQRQPYQLCQAQIRSASNLRTCSFRSIRTTSVIRTANDHQEPLQEAAGVIEVQFHAEASGRAGAGSVSDGPTSDQEDQRHRQSHMQCRHDRSAATGWGFASTGSETTPRRPSTKIRMTKASMAWRQTPKRENVPSISAEKPIRVTAMQTSARANRRCSSSAWAPAEYPSDAGHTLRVLVISSSAWDRTDIAGRVF